MMDVIAVLDAKVLEINEYVAHTTAEREKLTNEREKLAQRLEEIGSALGEAEADLRRLNRARNALQDLPDPEWCEAASQEARAAMNTPYRP